MLTFVAAGLKCEVASGSIRKCRCFVWLANLRNRRARQSCQCKCHPAQIEVVQGAIKVIYENLPFLIGIKPDERQSMAKFGEKNRTFVVKAAAIAAQNPDILPRSFNLDEMMADKRHSGRDAGIQSAGMPPSRL